MKLQFLTGYAGDKTIKMESFQVKMVQESVFLSGLNSMGMMISSSISTGSWRLTSAVLTENVKVWLILQNRP